MLIKLQKITNGCVTEVDLDYPKELHYLNNDYSKAPF